MPDNKSEKIYIGERIKRIRLRLGLTMEEFIERIDDRSGKGRSGAVNNWERGINAPNKKRLAKIADLGGVSIDYLLHGSHATNDEMIELIDKNEQGTANKQELKKLIEATDDWKVFDNLQQKNEIKLIPSLLDPKKLSGEITHLVFNVALYSIINRDENKHTYTNICLSGLIEQIASYQIGTSKVEDVYKSIDNLKKAISEDDSNG